jgi:hypothetical protein
MALPSASKMDFADIVRDVQTGAGEHCNVKMS